MPKLIYAGDKLAAAILEGHEIAMVRDALTFYAAHGPAVVDYAPHLRLLTDLNIPAPN